MLTIYEVARMYGLFYPSLWKRWKSGQLRTGKVENGKIVMEQAEAAELVKTIKTRKRKVA